MIFNNLPPELIIAILAVFGGVARYFDFYLKGSEHFVITRFIASLFVSAFSGFMTAQIALLLYPTWVYIGAGIGGYASTKVLDIIITIIQKRLGVTDDSSAKKP